jgi:hypothetical protein
MSCLTLSAGAEQEGNKGGNSEADGEGDQHTDVSIEVLLHKTKKVSANKKSKLTLICKYDFQNTKLLQVSSVQFCVSMILQKIMSCLIILTKCQDFGILCRCIQGGIQY